MKLDRVIVTLLVILGYAVALPRVPWLADRAVISAVGLIVTLGGWAVFARAWVDAWIGVSLAISLAVARVLFRETDELLLVLITTAILAYGYLSFTLLIGPWSWFFKRRFLRLLKHRRHVGVASLLLAEVHVNIVLAAYYNNQLPLALLISANVFGATALFIMALLGLTSWNFAQRAIPLPWWSVIHLGGLAGYVGLLSIAGNQPGATRTVWEQLALIGVVGYWIALTPTVASRLLHRTVNGWKQLHLLIYAAYAAVVIHIWTGVVSQRPPLTQLIFWTPVALVVGSHLAGRWLRRRRRTAPRQTGGTTPPAAPIVGPM